MTLGWAGLIFLLSTQGFGPHSTQRMLALALRLFHIHLAPHVLFLCDAVARKLAHVAEYGVFALLLYGLPVGRDQGRWRLRRAALCVLAACAYSFTDEFHQLFVAGRHSSLRDCGLDTLGASFAMLARYVVRKRK